MTEAEWLVAIEPHEMLEFFRSKESDRKLRLFAVACCRGIWEQITEERGRVAIEVAERYADKEAHIAELSAAHSAHDCTFGKYPHDGVYYAIDAATEHPNGFNPYYVIASNLPALIHRERFEQSKVLREIFGNPFRPITVDPAWLTSTVVALANGIYADRAFDRMPILADALEEAGCDNVDMLLHCRQPGEHVRGCWVVDLVLGKE